MVRKLIAGAAALSMMATPVLAAPSTTTTSNPAAKLSLSRAVPASARAGTRAGNEKLLGGGAFVAIIAAIAVITGIIIVANEDDSDSN